MSVQNKRVLITGSSHGIGAATAVAFAKEGCKIGINCNKDPQGAEAVAAQVREAGGEAEIFIADIAVQKQATGMVQDFISRFGGIDILINNAGGALKIPRGEFADMPLDYWEYQVNLNLNAAAARRRAAKLAQIKPKIILITE